MRRLLFKVSPAIQNLLVDAVVECDHDLAARWRDWTTGYAKSREVAGRTADSVFRKYAFAAFGARNDAEVFEMRDLLYDASPLALETFRKNLLEYMEQLSADLL